MQQMQWLLGGRMLKISEQSGNMVSQGGTEVHLVVHMHSILGDFQRQYRGSKV